MKKIFTTNMIPLDIYSPDWINLYFDLEQYKHFANPGSLSPNSQSLTIDNRSFMPLQAAFPDLEAQFRLAEARENAGQLHPWQEKHPKLYPVTTRQLKARPEIAAEYRELLDLTANTSPRK